jgi:hypothetical protein
MDSDNEVLTKILTELRRLADEMTEVRRNLDLIRDGSCEPPTGRSTTRF